MKEKRVMGIDILTVLFDGKLQEREIPSFRGAIIAISGRNPIFHNHAEGEELILRYPHIQYKAINGQAALVGIREGAEALRRLFVPGAMHVLKIGRDYREFYVRELLENVFEPSLVPGSFKRYHVHNWLPLNSENYAEYQSMHSLAGRISKLDTILTGNVLSLYKGLGVFVEEEVEAHVVGLEERMVTFKDVKMTAFEAVIECNFTLPERCGLGKGASHGFGVVRES